MIMQWSIWRMFLIEEKWFFIRVIIDFICVSSLACVITIRNMITLTHLIIFLTLKIETVKLVKFIIVLIICVTLWFSLRWLPFFFWRFDNNFWRPNAKDMFWLMTCNLFDSAPFHFSFFSWFIITSSSAIRVMLIFYILIFFLLSITCSIWLKRFPCKLFRLLSLTIFSIHYVTRNCWIPLIKVIHLITNYFHYL